MLRALTCRVWNLRKRLQEGVIIIGAYTRGFTFAQLEAFMSPHGPERPSLTLTSQWQPEFEHSLG